jgi:hypothetical protein
VYMGGIIGSAIGVAGAFLGKSGPSQGMETTAAQEQSLGNEFMADYGQRYGQQSAEFQQLSNAYNPIISAGPGQQGFNSPVLANLNSQALNNSAAAGRNARQAAGNFSAGQGGGGVGLQSGIQQQINASIDSSATNDLANQQNKIQEANYAVGRQNYSQALAGASALANAESPNAAGSAAGNELSSAFSSASKINDEKNAQSAQQWGSVAGLASDIPSALSAGISAMNPGADTGILDALG